MQKRMLSVALIVIVSPSNFLVWNICVVSYDSLGILKKSTIQKPINLKNLYEYLDRIVSANHVLSISLVYY